jgi:hypothetical protein
MIRNCDHSGFHSGVGKLTHDFRSIRFIVVCDGCGEEIREVDVQEYAPSRGRSGSDPSRHRRAA